MDFSWVKELTKQVGPKKVLVRHRIRTHHFPHTTPGEQVSEAGALSATGRGGSQFLTRENSPGRNRPVTGLRGVRTRVIRSEQPFE